MHACVRVFVCVCVYVYVRVPACECAVCRIQFKFIFIFYIVLRLYVHMLVGLVKRNVHTLVGEKDRRVRNGDYDYYYCSSYCDYFLLPSPSVLVRPDITRWLTGRKTPSYLLAH